MDERAAGATFFRATLVSKTNKVSPFSCLLGCSTNSSVDKHLSFVLHVPFAVCFQLLLLAFAIHRPVAKKAFHERRTLTKNANFC